MDAVNIRSGNVEVKTGRLPHERRHEVEEPNADTHSRGRLPVVPALAVRNHDQHDANRRQRVASKSRTPKSASR